MGLNIIRITSNKREADAMAKRITADLRKRKIKRKAYVKLIRPSTVQKLMRKGWKAPAVNYAVAMKNL